MIDYEKLKQAHELAKKSDRYYFEITFGSNYDNDDIEIELHDTELENYCEFECMDEFLSKLQELTETNLKRVTKYKVNDEVWRLNNEDHPEPLLIMDIDTISEEAYLDEYGCWWTEEQLYPTREALIDSQIKHWSSLKNQEKSTYSDDVSMEYSIPKFEGKVMGFNACFTVNGPEANQRVRCFRCNTELPVNSSYPLDTLYLNDCSYHNQD